MTTPNVKRSPLSHKTPTMVRRRDFVRWAGASALASSVAPLAACLENRGSIVTEGAGYGPLIPAGPELALPEGFSYTVLGAEGQLMSDGLPTPRAHDGMGLFEIGQDEAGHDLVRLVRNQEVFDPPGLTPPIVSPSLAWDSQAGGGTTTLEVRIDSSGRPHLERDFASLGGTAVNCAGGITPWGTWLTCEETTMGPTRGFSVPHGYIFEVPAFSDGPVDAIPLRDMGRFVHEAVAVDPKTGYVYETEDMNRRAGFYRFRPHTPEVLEDGGVLEMLAIRDAPQADLRTNQRLGVERGVEWVPIEDPDPETAEAEPRSVWTQGYALGGARFSRLEGCFFADQSVYFHATNGGDAQLGQVWRYSPSEESLTLVFESPSPEVLDSPDNITVSPRGGILICEDNAGTTHLQGLTRDGEIFPFAQNILNNREFAGACFSPGGRTLFINLQGDISSEGPGNPSFTLGIWGPWGDGPL